MLCCVSTTTQSVLNNFDWSCLPSQVNFPVTCSGGKYEIVQGLEISDFSRERMGATEVELREERAAIEELL